MIEENKKLHISGSNQPIGYHLFPYNVHAT